MKKMMLIAATAAGLMVMGTANAVTKTTQFDVTATVANACVIDSASPLNFTYVPGAVADSSSTIVVRCAVGRDFNIGLDQGLSTNRTMSSPTVASTLTYELYREAARAPADVWGTTIGTNTKLGTGLGMGAANAITTTVYGRIPNTPANEAALDASDYKDTVNVTLTY